MFAGAGTGCNVLAAAVVGGSGDPKTGAGGGKTGHGVEFMPGLRAVRVHNRQQVADQA